jgi:hypothetical protein
MKKNCPIGYAHDTVISASSSQFHIVKPFRSGGTVTSVGQAQRIAAWLHDQLADAAMREALTLGVPADDDDDTGDDKAEGLEFSLTRDRVARVLAMLDAKHANGGLNPDETKAREAATLRMYGAVAMIPYYVGFALFIFLAARTRYKAPLYLYIAAILCGLSVLAKGLAGLGLQPAFGASSGLRESCLCRQQHLQRSVQ